MNHILKVYYDLVEQDMSDMSIIDMLADDQACAALGIDFTLTSPLIELLQRQTKVVLQGAFTDVAGTDWLLKVTEIKEGGKVFYRVVCYAPDEPTQAGYVGIYDDVPENGISWDAGTLSDWYDDLRRDYRSHSEQFYIKARS